MTRLSQPLRHQTLHAERGKPEAVSCFPPHANWVFVPGPCRRACRGQSLIELAVFGSLAIIVIGVLISYILGTDANLRVTMESFRRAEAQTGLVPPLPLGDLFSWVAFVSPAPAGGGSATVTVDRFIPDPSHPFGMGSPQPATASANVIRDYRLHQPRILPSRTQLMVNGESIHCTGGFFSPGCTTAGLWGGFGLLDRYEEVWGGGAQPLLPNLPAIPFLAWIQEWVTLRVGPVVIQDPCLAELANYDACYRIARLIVDPAACTYECNRSRWWGGLISILDSGRLTLPCEIVCAIPILPEPPYVAGRYQANGRWVFPVLDRLFATGGGIRAMGIQPGIEWNATANDLLRVHNDTMEAITHSTVNQQDVVTRVLAYQQQFLGIGTAQGVIRRIEQTPRDERAQTNWTTPWTP